jgi:hypothetical protein
MNKAQPVRETIAKRSRIANVALVEIEKISEYADADNAQVVILSPQGCSSLYPLFP